MMDSENIVGDGLTKILLLMAMMWIMDSAVGTFSIQTLKCCGL